MLSGLRYSEDEKKDWANRYKGGETIASISRSTGAQRRTIMDALQKSGVKLRGNPRSFDRMKILELLKSGKSQGDVARELGCSRRLVSDVKNGKVKL